MRKIQNKARNCLITFATSVWFSVIMILTATNASAQLEFKSLEQFEYVISVADMIYSNYSGNVDNSILQVGVLKGMFGNLDKYTAFYTQNEMKTLMNGIRGDYFGIGIAMDKINEKVVITRVMDDSPAKAAGLLKGDVITDVLGESVALEKDIEVVANKIKGPKGTEVELSIQRANETTKRELSLIRDEIIVNPVKWEKNGDIATIILSSFNSHSQKYFLKALEEIEKQGFTKLILDLRDNLGGEVDQAVGIAKNFVPEGLITEIKFRSSKEKNQKYFSQLQNIRYRLAVLVNGESASASEILAGAIQDTNAGKLIGVKTYGKAKVQKIYPILTPDAQEKYLKEFGERFIRADELTDKCDVDPADNEIMGMAKITVGEYYTPKGRMIDKEGIKPDIEIKNPEAVHGVAVRSDLKLNVTTKFSLNNEAYEVMLAQTILRAMGYNISELGMKFNEETFNAVSAFQKDTNLFSYGVLDFTTQKKLNEKLDELIEKYDYQKATAKEILK